MLLVYTMKMIAWQLTLIIFETLLLIDDIKNSRGFSFTITLKPFGTSKQVGKVRNFGPTL